MQVTENMNLTGKVATAVKTARKAKGTAQAGIAMQANGTAALRDATGQTHTAHIATVRGISTKGRAGAANSAQARSTEAVQSAEQDLGTTLLTKADYSGFTLTQTQTALQSLEAKRKAWEEGALRASNDELYGLLECCFRMYRATQASDEVRKNFLALYKDSKLASTKGTSIITKVVRFVFGEKLKVRVFAYVKVLEIAEKSKPAGQLLPDFIRAKGGIEELRRNGDKVGESELKTKKDNRVGRAKAVLGGGKGISPQFKLDTKLAKQGDHNFLAALVRRNSDGTFEVVYASNSEHLIEGLLNKSGEELIAKAETTTSAGEAMERRQDLTDAIDQLALK